MLAKFAFSDLSRSFNESTDFTDPLWFIYRDTDVDNANLTKKRPIGIFVMNTSDTAGTVTLYYGVNESTEIPLPAGGMLAELFEQGVDAVKVETATSFFGYPYVPGVV